MQGNGDTYTGVIPGQPVDSEVNYYVEATTSAGKVVSNINTYKVAAKPAEPKTLFINEVNCGTKQFEIYNASDKEADIAGYVFKKDDSGDWTVPAGKGKIPAKGFLVFTAKNPDVNEGPSFGLSGTKGFKLTMLKDGEIVDEIDNSSSVEVDGVEVSTSSHIITLSTCIGGMPENRRLLIAVEQENRGGDAAVFFPADGQAESSFETPQ